MLKCIETKSDTKLLVVTKKQKIEDIIELHNKGIRMFGENRVQEAQSKFQSFSNLNKIELHLIGPLQTNKVKAAIKLFNVIQTIDRPKLVDEIVKNLSDSSKTKDFFIQVNIGKEDQKAGVLKKDLKDLYNYSIEKKINITGLMCIPPNVSDSSNFFEEMVDLRDQINVNLKLSMGMSNDYKTALNFHTNIIRIGSLIFK